MRPAQSRPPGSGLWPEVLDLRSGAWLIMMCLALFVLLFPFASYVAALSTIQEEWRLSNTEAGAIFSAFLAGYAASALLVVPLTDRLGPRHIFLVSAVVSVIAHVLFPLVATGLASALALRAVAGFGMVGVYMPGLRIIADRFPDRGRGMAMGMFVTASYAAYSVSLAATGGLMAVLEWRDAYLVMALASLACVPMMYLLLRKHRHEPIDESTGRLDLSVLGNRPARLFILGYSLHALELYAVRVWLPVFLASILLARGIDDSQAAVRAATVGGVAMAAGSLGPVMGGILSGRWGRATSAAAIFGLSGACSWLVGWTGDLPWGVIVAFAVVYGWAISADSSIYSTAVTEVASPNVLGSTMAVQAFLGFMGGVVGPVVMGGILDVSPEGVEWRVGYSFMGLLAVVAVAVLLRLHATSPGPIVVARSDGRDAADH